LALAIEASLGKTDGGGFTGQFLIDDSFASGEGVTDFEHYRVDPTAPLNPDFFVPDDLVPPPGVRAGLP
jgi:citronellol/citronellal dehydrogenase